MTEYGKPQIMALEDALKEIDRLKAINASLRSAGKVNRETKNSVFLDMFKRKEYLIRLYRDIHPDDQNVTEDDLTVVTIENVFTIKDYNDLGFLVGGNRRKLLIMIEAQAKWSVNVIIRIWEYVLDTIMNYLVNNGINLYDSAKVEIPDIETYVVYTGKSVPRLFSSGRLEMDECGRYILSLNKEYFEGKPGQPELLAKVIYMKNGSGILEEYIRFSQVFDEQMIKFKDEKDKAIQETFRICMEENMLKDYLENHRGEVEKIMMTMVSPEYIEKAEKKSTEIRATIKTMRDMGQSDQNIVQYLVRRFSLTSGYAQNWIDAVVEEEEDNIFV